MGKREPPLPEAWLAVARYPGGPGRVLCIADSEKAAREQYPDDSLDGWADDPKLWIVRDEPSLAVCHEGICLASRAAVRARENWLERHRKVLAKHLVDPRPADVVTFEAEGPLDPLASYESSAEGPCALPAQKTWPRCGECGEPMGFLSSIDFRSPPPGVAAPEGSLVVHLCRECGLVADPGTTSLTWIKPGMPTKTTGGRGKVRLGQRTRIVDYPTPHDLDPESHRDRVFRNERSIYLNFSVYATKLGGHVFWIQDDETPEDADGEPMAFIGQCIGTDDMELGDSGVAYLFHSARTDETKLVVQCF